jgi:hypothetical protein
MEQGGGRIKWGSRILHVSLRRSSSANRMCPPPSPLTAYTLQKEEASVVSFIIFNKKRNTYGNANTMSASEESLKNSPSKLVFGVV